MATNITTLSDESQSGTALADVHGGGGDKINALVNGHNNMRSGSATILAGQSSVTVLAAAVGGNYGGKPAFGLMAGSDATATTLLRATWSTNDLVLTANANAAADVLVYWFVDGRA